ncbi:MAG: hypothetical protein MJZ28_10175 [Paludibacteraceae bacterium]|nr:hypothetical protein [Paludibacteraceae bacterium]
MIANLLEELFEYRIDMLNNEIESLDDARDEMLVNESSYYSQRQTLVARKAEAINIKQLFEDRGLINNSEEIGMSEIGSNENLSLCMTDNMHIILFHQGIRVLELINPKICEVDILKKLLGMND